MTSECPPQTPRICRGRVFINAQQRSTDKPCILSSAHAACLLSPPDALDVCLLLPQFPRKRRWHVFVDAQRRIMHEPYMPSSAHAARLQIPLDTLDVRLPLPHSTHRRPRRVFINAHSVAWTSHAAHATRLLSPRPKVQTHIMP